MKATFLRPPSRASARTVSWVWCHQAPTPLGPRGPHERGGALRAVRTAGGMRDPLLGSSDVRPAPPGIGVPRCPRQSRRLATAPGRADLRARRLAAPAPPPPAGRPAPPRAAPDTPPRGGGPASGRGGRLVAWGSRLHTHGRPERARALLRTLRAAGASEGASGSDTARRARPRLRQLDARRRRLQRGGRAGGGAGSCVRSRPGGKGAPGCGAAGPDRGSRSRRQRQEDVAAAAVARLGGDSEVHPGTE